MPTTFYEDCSLRCSHIDNRNTTLEGYTGQESLFGIVLTLKIIVDGNGMGLGDISFIELYNGTAHCCIVTVTGNCA